MGQTTGDVYQVVGVSQGSQSVPLRPGANEFTHIAVFNLIGPRPDANLLSRQTLHITVNANGETTVDFNNLSMACQ